MSRLSNAGALIVISLAMTGNFACSQKPEPPPQAYAGPMVTSASLGVEATRVVNTGYKLLEDEPSIGRFPGAITVAKLAEPNEFWWSDNQQQWHVGDIDYPVAISWNSLGNRIPSIREIIVLDVNSTVSPTSNLLQIASSAQRLDAALCLVYGPAPAQDEHAAFWGVIINTIDAAKVAFVQAEAGPLDFEQPAPDRLSEDRRHWDVNYLARVRFQQQVRLCLLDLIERDRPATATQPSPWLDRSKREQQILILPPRPTPAW